MARGAQALEVALVFLKDRVVTTHTHVVDLVRYLDSALALAMDAERVGLEVVPPDALPGA